MIIYVIYVVNIYMKIKKIRKSISKMSEEEVMLVLDAAYEQLTDRGDY